jgi:hypothetical protein
MMSQQERVELGAMLTRQMEEDLARFGNDPKSVYLMGEPEMGMAAPLILQMRQDMELFGNNSGLIWIMHEVNGELARPEIEFIDKERIGAPGAMAVRLGAKYPQLQRIMRHVMLILP